MTYTVPPPGPLTGGFVVIKYTNGARAHRAKFHVALFDPATGAYTTPTATETHVGDTVANLIGIFEPFYNNAWTFSWDKLYEYVAGIPVEIPLTQVVIPALGASAGVDSGFSYIFQCLIFRTALLGRARYFMIEPTGVPVQHSTTYIATRPDGGGAAVAYLTGIGTEVVGHDGGKWTAPAHVTFGVNKRLRRRAGDA